MSAGLFILTMSDGKIHCAKRSFPVIYDYDKRLHTVSYFTFLTWGH